MSKSCADDPHAVRRRVRRMSRCAWATIVTDLAELVLFLVKINSSSARRSVCVCAETFFSVRFSCVFFSVFFVCVFSLGYENKF